MKSIFLSVLFLMSTICAIANPALNVTPSVINNLHYVVGGGPSPSQSIVLQSSDMGALSGNLVIDVSSVYDYFQLSLDNVSFSKTITIPYSNSVLPSTNLYVRLKAGHPASVSNYVNGYVTATASNVGALIQPSGIVTFSPIQVDITGITPTSASFSWYVVNSTPDGWAFQLDQSPTPPSGDGTLSAFGTYNASNLSPNTTYYFHARHKWGVNFTNWTTKSFTTGTQVGIQAASTHDAGIFLMPNPSLGTFIVSGQLHNTDAAPVNLEIINALGKLVHSTQCRSAAGRIHESVQTSLLPGSYWVRVVTGVGSHSSRLVIQ